MRSQDLHQRLADLGAKPLHCGRIVRAWLQGRALDACTARQRAEDFLPLGVRHGLPQVAAELEGIARLHSEHPASDGSSRLLVELADRQMVESVLLPRGGLCVSTQVGCAVGCVFCMTGRSGLLRQVGSLEMVAQVVLARRRRAVKKVVFMGMGEPAHNLDNVLEAIDLLGTDGGIGHKNLVFSTVGDPRVFERLPRQRVKPALALSLHSTRAELRRQLLPKAPPLSPEELVEAGEAYARRVDYPIQYQWTLLEGINDS
ncbi:RNA methyltransferase, partial [Pseudomonas aeruginosa]